MRVILAKAVLIGIFSVAASLMLSFAIVPHLGGQVAGAGLIMTIVCPFVISVPASFVHIWQADRVKRAEAATSEALGQLAVAYENLRLTSRRDGLTGILNRGAFLNDLATFSREGISGGLLFLDLDHFKSINDRHGHAVGDEVLRQIGKLLARYSGQLDIAGRLGGEEFALFQGGISAADIARRCEEVRVLIERIEIRSVAGNRISVSASIGALLCEQGFDPQECLKTADMHLYQAKSLGRNQAVSSL